GDAFTDGGPLRTAAGMDAQPCIVFAHTALHQHIVGLLEADAVSVKIPRHTILNHCAKTAIEKNAAAATAVEGDILILIPVNDEVFDARAFEVVAADDREDGCGLSFVRQGAIIV